MKRLVSQASLLSKEACKKATKVTPLERLIVIGLLAGAIERIDKFMKESE